MPLKNLHTNWNNGSYEADRNKHIKEKENSLLYNSRNSKTPEKLQNLNAHNDGANSIAFGYGYDLFKNVEKLGIDLQAYASSQALKNVKNLIYAYNKTHIKKDKESIENLVDKINEQISLKTEANATTLLNVKIQTYETALSKSLGKDNLLDSKERAAVISVIYNLTNATQEGIGKAIPSLITAIRNDNRAEAWYEIRYNTNGGDSRKKAGGGIANRRSSESNLFGLYDALDQNVTTKKAVEEAVEILKMYIRHEDKIKTEEKEFGNYIAYQGANSIAKQLQPALSTLEKFINKQEPDKKVKLTLGNIDNYIDKIEKCIDKENVKTDKTPKVAETSRESTLEELARTWLQRYGDNDIDVKYAKVVRAEIKEFEENRPKNDNDDSVHRVG